jgi:hypothetical protein
MTCLLDCDGAAQSFCAVGRDFGDGSEQGVRYDGSNEMYFVGWNPQLKMVKAGPSLISVPEAEEPYLRDPAEVAQGFNAPIRTVSGILLVRFGLRQWGATRLPISV